ncbi:hypothetical protein [Streptomyces albidoflavus]|uniref:hypothetical protein n=1 Tax=Streptomyces albidoflavus TaxID=1886 RepID=UPI0033BF2F0E
MAAASPGEPGCLGYRVHRAVHRRLDVPLHGAAEELASGRAIRQVLDPSGMLAA